MSEPRTSPEFNDILAQCLDEVLRGQKSLTECLTAYPTYAADLKPALQIGLLTARLKSPEMSSQSVDALEMRLRAQMTPARRSNISYLPLGISRLAASIAIVFILALGSGAGLVSASADDLPGDTLYGVKRLWETIVLALAPLTGQPGELWLWIANTRLDEANALYDQGKLSEDALIDLYSATYQVSQYDYGDGDASAIIAYFNRAYVAFMNRITAPLGAEAVYQDMVDAVAPSRIQNGTIIPLISELPPSLSGTPVNTPSPTPILPTATLRATNTPSPTATATESPTITASATSSATRTPRIPVTATRTPTFTPSPTVTLTYTPSPTMTWTPLPLPGGIPPITEAATQVPPGFIPSSTPNIPPTPDGTERIRATQQSVFLTQTAGPPISTPTDTP